MKSLASLLEKRKSIQEPVFSQKDIFYVFGKVIREEFGNIGEGKLIADFFKNKTLFVRSANSLWASELWTNRSKVIRKMNQQLGKEAILEIKTK